MESSLSKLSRTSDTTAAIHDAQARWDAFVRYCDDDRIEIDNSAAERALRAIALGRNYLFAGPDRITRIEELLPWNIATAVPTASRPAA